MPSISMTVNGKPVSGQVEGRTLLSQFLRENLRLTGTHVGCDTSQCGARSEEHTSELQSLMRNSYVNTLSLHAALPICRRGAGGKEEGLVQAADRLSRRPHIRTTEFEKGRKYPCHPSA